MTSKLALIDAMPHSTAYERLCKTEALATLVEEVNELREALQDRLDTALVDADPRVRTIAACALRELADEPRGAFAAAYPPSFHRPRRDEFFTPQMVMGAIDPSLPPDVEVRLWNPERTSFVERLVDQTFRLRELCNACSTTLAPTCALCSVRVIPASG